MLVLFEPKDVLVWKKWMVAKDRRRPNTYDAFRIVPRPYAHQLLALLDRDPRFTIGLWTKESMISAALYPLVFPNIRFECILDSRSLSHYMYKTGDGLQTGTGGRFGRHNTILVDTKHGKSLFKPALLLDPWDGISTSGGWATQVTGEVGALCIQRTREAAKDQVQQEHNRKL